jgi:hypothetical protein
VRCAVLGFCACAGLAQAKSAQADYTPAPFSDYQTILDRMPFGALPPNFGEVPPEVPAQTDAQTQALQQKIAQQINMSAINVTPDGSTAIGFTDLGAKPPANYYLPVGTSAGGWTVVDADYDLEVAIIEKDGIQINLKLGKGLIDAAALQALIAAAGPAAPPPSALQPAAAAAAEGPLKKRREAAFKTGTEQLLSMQLDLPPGVEAPPLPLLTDDMLAKDVEKALKTTINLEEDDTEKDVALKTEVAAAKEEMKSHLAQGGTATSYLERLRERRDQEVARQQEEREAAREKLRELATKITAEELKKQRRAINQRLIEEGIDPVYGE